MTDFIQYLITIGISCGIVICKDLILFLNKIRKLSYGNNFDKKMKKIEKRANNKSEKFKLKNDKRIKKLQNKGALINESK